MGGVSGLELLPEQACCGAVERSQRPRVLLCPSPVAPFLLVCSQKAGQGPWHHTHGPAPVRARVSLSHHRGLMSLVPKCEMSLVPKWGPHVETWPLGAWVPAWSHLGGSRSRKAVAPNAVGPDGSPQTGCSCQRGLASEHRALGLSPPSCPFTVTLAHLLSTCACWSLLCKLSARQTAWGSAPPCCPGAVSVWSEACLPCSSGGRAAAATPAFSRTGWGP